MLRLALDTRMTHYHPEVLPPRAQQMEPQMAQCQAQTLRAVHFLAQLDWATTFL